MTSRHTNLDAHPPRYVVVTGASSGIGRAIAERFAAAGDHVTAVGRDTAALDDLSRASGRLTTAVCDVTREDAVRELFASLPDVDVLVCNAGAAESAPLRKTSLESWRRMLDVNATGVFLSVREVVPSMSARGTGRIVVIASTAGRAGAPYTAAYTASKHAAVGLMRAVAAEIAGTGVTANALCPTFVDTPMTARSVQNIAARTGRSEDESRDALERTSPLGRLLAPGEVADAAIWLASTEAVAINGQAVVLDGGGIQA
jgi:NAD(P)-dependent dehydrogenase (short-subunit alcohol dehydrogenase family)